MRRRIDDWAYFTEAEAAAGDLIGLHDASVILKAGNLLGRGGYQDLVRRLAATLLAATKRHDQDAAKGAAKRLDRKWTRMGATERAAAAHEAAQELLKVPRLVVPKVTEALLTNGRGLVRAVKEASATQNKLAIDVGLNRVDARIVEAAATSQGNYITDQYGNRAVQFEQRARDIVAEGLEAGYDSAAIGERLALALTDPLLRKAASYWETVASIHTARARSWGLLSSFQDASIERFQWVSVLDEATSEQCRYMHGKVFQTTVSAGNYQDVASGAQDVEDAQPFLQMGRTQDGDQFFYTGRGDSKRVVAHVETAAFGQKDQVGRYRGAGEEALQKMGVSTPPLHGRCRSTIVPAD